LAHTLPVNPDKTTGGQSDARKEIWLAGGCFWGVEAYFSRIRGVVATTAGYANGKTENPTYEEVCSGKTGHAETVHVVYNPEVVSLDQLLRHFFRIIDPTARNRQGNDIGLQYRSGIYYRDPEELPVIGAVLAEVQKEYQKPVVTEVLPLANFYPAEEYHQKYLEKNPGGYCHVDLSLAASEPSPPATYRKPSPEEIKKKLTPLQYDVTQLNQTEPPFANAYWDNHEPGLYVDVVTGEPLFSSKDKFDSGTGWPSFTRPIDPGAVAYRKDFKAGIERVEVRSKIGDSHLGHVFDDGPVEKGGRRFCINSAALRFIPLAEMEKEGYGAYIPLVE
jgi:peptide methionine sulfoxide reductase msrA/msrB